MSEAGEVEATGEADGNQSLDTAKHVEEETDKEILEDLEILEHHSPAPEEEINEPHKVAKDETDQGVLESPFSPGILKHLPPEEGKPLEVIEDIPDEKKKGKPKKRKSVHVWTMFRFADIWDILMIIFGFFSAIASGVALPGHMLLFGQVINNFVYYGNVITNNTDIGGTLHDAALSYSTSVNMTCSPDLFINGSLFSVPSEMLLCQSETQSIVLDILQFVCDPPAQLLTQINLYSLYYVGLATGVLITMFIASLFWNISAYRQTKRMRKAFYHSVLHQEIGWYDVNEANELSTRLADDIEKIQAGIGEKVSLFLNYFSTFVSGFVIAFSISWKMALVVSVMLPLLAFMAGSIAKIIATFTVREQSAYAAAGAVAEEVISSIRTVVAFGGEDHEIKRYDVQLGKAKAEGMKKGFFASIVVGLLYLVIFSTYALGFWFGSTRIIACELSAGDVVTVLFAVIIGSFSLGNALPELETFGTALGSASVVFEIIDRKPLIDASSEEGLVPEKLDGNIKFSDVIFHYPARPNVQVLKGLDLEIRNGQTVALVGSSGCGKSTVIQLIQRFYNPDGGQITLDNHDIASLNLKWLRSNIGVVSQEPVLFDTTIAENIRYGREDASMEDIQAAAKSANAHDFITNLPDGYNTDVGEKGAQLSGGQKQRIAIARALVRDPKVLLLDEATSALDTEGEKVVQDALDKAREGRTTIVIAHRLSTIQNADIIVSIDSGRVSEMGTHSELMDLEGIYFHLVTAQTIVEEEDPTEGLGGFKAAVKRTISKQRGESESSGSNPPPPYIKQSSSLSHDSMTRDTSWYGLSDQLSRFSVEDIPIASAPSPFPGRRHNYSGSADVMSDSDGSGDDGGDDDGGDDVGEEEDSTNREEDLEGSGTKKMRTKKMRRSTAKRLLRRRNKMTSDKNLRKVSTKELFQLNMPDWPLVLTGIILSAFIGTLFPLMAVLFSDVLRIFGLSDPEEIASGAEILAGGFVGLAVASGLVYFFASFTLAVAGERLTKRLRYRSFKAILRQDIAWFDLKTNSTGALTTRLASDSAQVKGATGIRLGTIFQTVCGLITAVIIAFEASWELTLVMMIAFPILGTVAFFQIRLLAGRSKSNKMRLEESGKTAVESIDNIRTVVGLGVEQRFLNKYYSLLHGPFKDNVKSVFLQASVIALAQSATFYLYSGGYSFGAYLVINERATYDELFRVYAAVIFTALSLGRASSFAPDASKAHISAARILSLLDRNPLIDSTSTEGQKLDTTTGDIAVKSVHFNYPARPDVKVLQGMDVSISPGQTLALVGPSGCGKSTVVSLLERFYDPVLGSTTLEGTDLRDYNLRWLRSQIGIVSQEPVLFDCSIADNIRYGTLFKDVSDTEIIQAAKSANIHSFIESLPEGYNTNVGSKGTQLSGGQKQRIAIARALIRDPKVLLLDEATSALDTESEKVVQEALDKAREGRTTIVIAHRLSTIYNSDLIAVIHNGQVIESGNHTQLMAQCGAYYHLNTVQLQEED